MSQIPGIIREFRAGFPSLPFPGLRSRLEFCWSLEFPSQICKGTPQHEEICLGLFTLVLTEPAQAQKVRKSREKKGGNSGILLPGIASVAGKGSSGSVPSREFLGLGCGGEGIPGVFSRICQGFSWVFFFPLLGFCGFSSWNFFLVPGCLWNSPSGKGSIPREC